jgi:prevent-host-death family protein
MKHVGIKQARQELPDLVDRAESGEEIIITRQGRPVAKLVRAATARRLLPSLANFRDSIGRDGSPAAELVREERDGR